MAENDDAAVDTGSDEATVDTASAAAPASEPDSRRTRARQKRTAVRIALWVVTLLALTAVAVAGVYVLRSLNQSRDAVNELARASALLEEAEPDLLLVDQAVQVEISSAVATQSVEAAALAGNVGADVAAASQIITGLMDKLPQDSIALARALKDGADARVEMMEVAPTILEADRKAALAIPFADQVVAEIKAAEDRSAAAVVEFNKHTAEGVRASDDHSIQAEAHLGAARSAITGATTAFPEADFSAFTAYIEAKLGLIALAKEIDALWLAGNLEGSNAKLAVYNQRDAEIVAMAQALPTSVRDPIANAYDALTAASMTEYFEARERARSAGERVEQLSVEATATAD